MMEQGDREGMLSFEVKYTLTEEQVAGLLCAAWDGGSAYWARSDGRPFTLEANLGIGVKVWRLRGLPVVVRDVYEDERGKEYVLDLEAIRRGVELFAQKAPKQLADLLRERDDSTTGDCFLQLCLFGEVIYG